MKDFLKSTLKTSLALFISLGCIAIVFALWSWTNDRSQREEARPFETVKEWSIDLQDQIAITANVRTKLVSNIFYAAIVIKGHPSYLSADINKNGSFNLTFVDSDGFEIFNKALFLKDFTNIVDNKSNPTGLSLQIDEFMSLEDYQRFSKAQLGWNFDTNIAENKPTPTPVKADHCAPNLSRQERLDRLAQHGSVRQVGTGQYQAGNRTISFFEYDGSLLYCR